MKWALGSITANKAGGCDGIPFELFQILKQDAVRMLQSVCQQIWKTQQWPQDWKRSVFIQIPNKSNSKECSNYHTIALISHAQRVKCLPTMQVDLGLIQGQEDHLEKEMETHSSTFAWKIPWMEEPAGYSPWGHKESDMSERLHFHMLIK